MCWRLFDVLWFDCSSVYVLGFNVFNLFFTDFESWKFRLYCAIVVKLVLVVFESVFESVLEVGIVFYLGLICF